MSDLLDVACLAWYGWPTVSSTVDRARVWYRTFGLEQVAFAVLNGESSESISRRCASAAAWLQRTAD